MSKRYNLRSSSEQSCSSKRQKKEKEAEEEDEIQLEEKSDKDYEVNANVEAEQQLDDSDEEQDVNIGVESDDDSSSAPGRIPNYYEAKGLELLPPAEQAADWTRTYAAAIAAKERTKAEKQTDLAIGQMMRQIKATIEKGYLSSAHMFSGSNLDAKKLETFLAKLREEKHYRWSMYATNSGGSPSSFVVVDWGTIERIPNDCRNKRVDTAQLISSLGNAAAIFDKAQRYDIKVQEGEWY